MVSTHEIMKFRFANVYLDRAKLSGHLLLVVRVRTFWAAPCLLILFIFIFGYPLSLPTYKSRIAAQIKILPMTTTYTSND
jgi:hypothetical protein